MFEWLKNLDCHTDILPPGEFVVEYLVKANYQGEFSVLAARVEEMYDDVYATSSSRKITIH